MLRNLLSWLRDAKLRLLNSMAPSTFLEYTVNEGDSLWRVAGKLGVSWESLRKANADVADDVLHPGSILKIPENEDPAAVTALEPPDAIEVGEGDSLWTISQRWGVDWRELKSENKLKDDVILPGEVLRMPGLKAAAELGLGGWMRKTKRRIASQRTKPVVVREGDTAWDLAERFGITVKKLQVHRANADALTFACAVSN